MRLDGRRTSNNVDDRRGMGGGMGVGRLGLGGVIVVALITWLMGGNPMDVLQMMESGGMSQTSQQFTPEEDELAKFSSQILAGTEDVWTELFNNMGLEYEPPRLVLFTGAVQSGCGGASASTGPFYCSADQCVYIDLSFFTQMKRQLGADGDFAYAYVIAHEVGHHVQYLLGTLDKAHSAMSRSDQKTSNQISVRLELQADFYAGVWAYHDNRLFHSLEDGDIEEGLNVASVIGDDYLQKKAQGYEVPESFNHGRSSQRVKWLKRGITTGDLRQGDTFTPSYTDL